MKRFAILFLLRGKKIFVVSLGVVTEKNQFIFDQLFTKIVQPISLRGELKDISDDTKRVVYIKTYKFRQSFGTLTRDVLSLL